MAKVNFNKVLSQNAPQVGISAAWERPSRRWSRQFAWSNCFQIYSYPKCINSYETFKARAYHPYLSDHIRALSETPVWLQLKHTSVRLCKQGFAHPKAAHVKSPKLETYSETPSTNIKMKRARIVLIVFYISINKGFPFVYVSLVLITLGSSF